MFFENDTKDRKRRFLRGLNCLLGLESPYLENSNILIKNALRVTIPEFRTRLANFYGLELTTDEIKKMMDKDINTGEFTEQFCPVIYETRGETNLDSLLGGLIKQEGGEMIIDAEDLESSLKYGLNGNRWCDVAEGPCSCGAWHK